MMRSAPIRRGHRCLLGPLVVLLLTHPLMDAQLVPRGGFWNPGASNFFDNLNKGILPGGVKVSDMGGFPGDGGPPGAGLGGRQAGVPGSDLLGSVIPGVPGGKARSPDVDCQIEPDPGPCSSNRTRFYYDAQAGRCLTFSYGGCLGNPNNYQTEQACLQRCSKKAEPTTRDRCQLPADPGPCRGRQELFFYNGNTGNCEMFTYGGCGGNQNAFPNIDACLQACKPGGPGPNQPGSGPADQGPQRVDICQLPPDFGGCQQRLVRFFYDPRNGICRTFDYSGCQGNDNNFENEASCLAQCRPDIQLGGPQGPPGGDGTFTPGDRDQGPRRPDERRPIPTNVCLQEPVRGPCRGQLTRFYYDANARACREFVYGGCEGNDNNFENLQACEQACVPAAPPPQVGPGVEEDPCLLPPARGPCRGNLVRFYYDSRLGRCVDFTYGGCQGNKNNFEALETCERRCRPAPGPTPAGGEVEDNVCLQPPIRGRCRGNLVRFYYDSRLGDCTDFVYGGCDGNGNNFQSIEACQRQCKPAPPPPDNRGGPNDGGDICLQPPVAGPCRQNLVRFFYDSESGRCTDFIYGGCQGNGNNFESKQACERQCIPAPPSEQGGAGGQPFGGDICTLPPSRGSCQGDLTRYFFDPRDGNCKSFMYGGCKGNENNFENIEECESQCKEGPPPTTPRPDNRDRGTGPQANLCTLPPERGPCRENFSRFYFDPRFGLCNAFIYSGCEGNPNNFPTREACEQECKPAPPIDTSSPDRGEPDRSGGGGVAGPGGRHACTLSPERGPCQGNNVRFHFDINSGTCQDFIYGGCGGNANNFNSKVSCEARCKPAIQPTNPSNTNVCGLPPVQGECRGNLVRFYFDPNLGECRKFIYGGCNGNLNNFESVPACENVCKPTSSGPLPPSPRGPPGPVSPTGPISPSGSTGDLCSLPPITGPCTSGLTRYYYDQKERRCIHFTYGGCQGNENNFNSRASCEARCKRGPPTSGSPPATLKPTDGSDVCTLPALTGKCRARFVRFFYDRESGECRQFVYGGCNGNANNFRDKQSCEDKCKGTVPEKHDCTSPSATGRCLAFFRRFFFNINTGKCESFVYGGCEGNANNYRTRGQCEAACLPPTVAPPSDAPLVQCLAPARVAACVDLCRNDSNCGVGQHCCFNGCGRLCIRDAEPKDGSSLKKTTA